MPNAFRGAIGWFFSLLESHFRRLDLSEDYHSLKSLLTMLRAIGERFSTPESLQRFALWDLLRGLDFPDPTENSHKLKGTATMI
jgi:hypothetical protein